MDHVAILKKSFHFLPRILSSEKTIESRWYFSRRVPWDRVSKGDWVYFKNTGEPLTVKAKIQRVEQYEITPDKAWEILKLKRKMIGISSDGLIDFYERVKYKKYCILVYLETAQSIQPVAITKDGFGSMTAWMTVSDINTLIQ